MRRFCLMLALLLALSLAPFCALADQPAPALELYFFDQNPQLSDHDIHGDCTLIRFPDGQTMLVDCGMACQWPAIAEWLKGMGLHHIDYFVATHMHTDHVGGFQGLAVLGSISFGRIITSGYGYPNQDADYSFQRTLKALGWEEIPVRAGDSLEIGGARLDFLWPLPELKNLTFKENVSLSRSDAGELLNLNALVFHLSYGDFSILMTGDIHTPSEAQLLSLYPGEALKSSVLKAAHHGLSTSNSPIFVSVVDPQAIIAMTQVTYRLDGLDHFSMNKGVPFYRTVECGTIHLSTDGSAMTIESRAGSASFDLAR